MLNYLRKIYTEHRETISYLFFGALTTAVNFIIFYPLYNFLYLAAVYSNAVAWLGAVIFAFFVNKQFVFRDSEWSLAAACKQAVQFLGCRVFSGVLETALVFLTADLLQLNGNLWKIIISIVVIVVNYLSSKLFVFKGK